MFRALAGPVGIANGRHCRNEVSDQETVMGLLDRITSANGGTRMPEGSATWPVPQRGFCNPFLHERILLFQRSRGLFADGVIDLNGQTIGLMRQLAGDATQRHSSTTRLTPDQIGQLQKFLWILHAIVNHPHTIRKFSQERMELLRAIPEVEEIAKQQGVTPKPVPGPVMVGNNFFVLGVALTLYELIVIALILCAVEWFMCFPTYRKASKALWAMLSAMMSTAAGHLSKIKAETERLRDTVGRYRCKDLFDPFLNAVQNLLKIFKRTIYTTPSKVSLKPLAAAFVKAYVALLKCLGPEAARLHLLVAATEIMGIGLFFNWLSQIAGIIATLIP